MENNLDSPSLGNFSIQDTMEMGMGNQELLSDLFAPDSATSNPDDIKDIDEPAAAPAAKKVPGAKPAAKTLSLIHI